MKTSKNQNLKYNILKNISYMIYSAIKFKNINVILISLILATLAIISTLLNLFQLPVILLSIESKSSINELIAIILLFVGSSMLINSALAYFNSFVLSGRLHLRYKLLSKVHVKFMTTSYPNTENVDFLKKLDRAKIATTEFNSATQMIWYTLTDLLRDITGFIIYMIFIVSIDFFMVAVVLVTTIIGFFVNNYINSWGYRHRDIEAEYSRKLHYINAKSGDHKMAKDIRIFGMRGWLEDIYNSTFRLYRSFIARCEKTYIWANIIDVIFTLLRNGVAYCLLINMVLKEGLSASQFILHFAAIGGFTAWVSGILDGCSALYRQSLDISAMREYLEYPEVFQFENGESLQPDNDQDYEIELRNVSFKYPHAKKNTINNINLKIRPGEKLAIVGLNGSGKTTLIKLICGFYDPTNGEVLLNGVNIKKYNRRDYYLHFMAVFQDFSIIAGTIQENIKQMDEEIDMDRILDCIQKAGLLEKINSFPDKFDTYLGKQVYPNAIELSGGETQRLILARALYKNAPIIVLDEPTASLDPIAESQLYKKYNDLSRGRTAIYISHRLASTLFCDRIILIENNTIAEEGTHDELLLNNGSYAKMYRLQGQYYKVAK